MKAQVNTKKVKSYNNKPLKDWTYNEVYNLIGSLGKEKCWVDYAKVLKEEEMDGYSLGIYDDINLLTEDFPMIKKIHRQKLACEISKLNKKQDVTPI